MRPGNLLLLRLPLALTLGEPILEAVGGGADPLHPSCAGILAGERGTRLTPKLFLELLFDAVP